MTLPPFRWLTGLALLTLLIYGAACSPPPQPLPGDKPVVAVSILPLKGLVERVAGDRVHIQVLVGPGQSPATYEPGPRQVARLAQARTWLGVGVPFEEIWGPRLQEGLPTLKLEDMSRGVRKLELSENHGDHQHTLGLDPHIWTDPLALVAIAHNIRDTLGAIDAENLPEYTRRCETLVADLHRLHEGIETLLAPHRGEAFFVYHPSWAYFARRYGLQQIAIETDGKEPGPRGLAQFVELGRDRGVRTVFVQRQFRSSTAQALAEELDLALVEVDPLAEDMVIELEKISRIAEEALR